ncbi:hypothetical protein EC988_002520 [Linderina pennispora]|nr:hypothetical protein EC988_002520 [Linderina pennispora]
MIASSSKEKLSGFIAKGKKNLSKEQLKPLLSRLRGIIIEARKDDTVQKSMASMSNLYTTMYVKSKAMAKDARGSVKDHAAKEDMIDTRNRFEDVLKNLGAGYSVVPIFSALKLLGKDYHDREDIRELVGDAKEFSKWAVALDPEELSMDEFTERGSSILNRSRELLDPKSSEHFDTLSNESKGYIEAVKKNPVIEEYTDSMKALTYAVIGKGLKGDAWRKHMKALTHETLANLPVLVQSIRYVPLPRIAGQNKDLEFAADNIVLDLKRFVPEHMSFDSHTEVYPRSALLHKKHAMKSRMGFDSEQFFYHTITGANCVARNVAFYVKKKTGIPRIAEKGIANMVIGGRGMDISIKTRMLHASEKKRMPINKKSSVDESDKGAKLAKKLEDHTTELDSSRTYPERQFDIAEVAVKIHSLDVDVRHNKHNVLSGLAIPLVVSVAKRQIERQIAKSISDGIVRGDMLISKYGHVATHIATTQGKSLATKSVAAVKKSAKTSKEKYAQLKGKAKTSKDKAKDEADKAKEKAKEAAESAKADAKGAKDKGDDDDDKPGDKGMPPKPKDGKDSNPEDDSNSRPDEDGKPKSGPADKAKDKAKGGMDDAKDKAKGGMDDAKDKAKDVMDDTKNKAKDAMDDTKNKAKGAMDDAKSKAKDVEEALDENKPKKSKANDGQPKMAKSGDRQEDHDKDNDYRPKDDDDKDGDSKDKIDDIGDKTKQAIAARRDSMVDEAPPLVGAD